MPFTFAHPAIILPLKRYFPSKFSLTGLVSGSLIPDFEYFLRMNMQSHFSHTFAGIIYFGLPLALLLSLIFHHIIRDALIQNLPHLFRSRLKPFLGLNWLLYFSQNKAIVISSILIGALSHLFWDDFTHKNGFWVQQIPILQNHLTLFGRLIFYYKILQHLSTLIGLSILFFTLLNLPKYPDSLTFRNHNYWSSVIGLTLLIVLLRLIFLHPNYFIGTFIVTIISASMISLTISPLFLKLIREKPQIREPSLNKKD